MKKNLKKKKKKKKKKKNKRISLANPKRQNFVL